MTSGLVLNEFNLDLSPSGFLVALGLVVLVIVVLAAVAGVGVVDERVVVGRGGVEVVAGALGGHVWGGNVCVLGHRLGRGERELVLGDGLLVLGRIRRRNVRVWKRLRWLAPAKGHKLVKRTGRGRGRPPPIRTRTRNGEEL